MFDMNAFEIEYKNFIIGLKKKKYGENYEGYEKDKEEVKNMMKNKVEKKQDMNKYQRIIQLRKDIQNGNVVKVPCGNGRFVWKKIK